MKRILFLFACVLFMGQVFAGGLVTNTNQSAMFVRMPARDGVIGIDGVFYNPAGLTKLGKGLHFSLNNQIIGQKKTIMNNYPYLAGRPESEYVGNVSAPLFPGVYAVFNTGKFAVSIGWNPIGGGGGAEYKDGLPSFEMPISDLVPALQGQLAPLDSGVMLATGGLVDPGFRNVGGYNANLFFEGTSVYFGYQANVSYAINDMISVALGGRLVTAKNTTSGYVKGITVDAPTAYGGTQTAGNYLRAVASTAYPDATTKAILNGTAAALDVKTADKEVDIEETGTGITPIISVNIQPIPILNISLKYEHQTKLELETKVIDGKDGGGMYVDGEKTKASMPSMISAGVSVNAMEKLIVGAGVHYFLDKNLDWEGIDLLIDKNSFEAQLGVEYKLNPLLSISGGYAYANSGVTDLYQSDLDYNLASNTVGGGLAIHLASMLEVNLGAMYVMYQDTDHTFNHNFADTGKLIPVTENYGKTTWLVGVGLNVSLAK